MAFFMNLPKSVFYCRNCNARILKITTGTIRIGSPLLKCKNCGRLHITPHRSEWYNHPNRSGLMLMYLLLFLFSFLFAFFYEIFGYGATLSVAFEFAVYMSIVIQFFVLPDYIRIWKSKQRMKDPNYLQQLLQHKLISEPEYQHLSGQTK